MNNGNMLSQSEIKEEIIRLCSKHNFTFEDAKKLFWELADELEERAMKTKI